MSILREAKTADVDNVRLAYAEIQLDSTDNNGILSYANTANIRGIFDQTAGLLIFIGDASLAAYDTALRSVTYSTSDSTLMTHTLTFRLNDGITFSSSYKKAITSGEAGLEVEIPTGFTPNNDNVNDRWEISLLQKSENTKVALRIYNKMGVLLFESDSLEKPWDGKFDGDILPSDSYFYTIVISNEKRQEIKKGIVTILR